MTADTTGASEKPVTDINSGAVLCGECGTLFRAKEGEGRCPYCHKMSRVRIKNSVSRTWALVIASMILYVPANLFPIMTLEIMGDERPNTILGGIIQFYQHGMYFICAVVFVASFVVPIFKLVSLVYLLITLKRGNVSKMRRTKLYGVVEVIGKWSMLDVFVVCVMTGLVNTDKFSITAGVGIVFFASVVIMTMLASRSFDPRLIWDYGEEDDANT